MLANQQQASGVVYRHHADGGIQEMDHAVDAGAAVGPVHLVVEHLDPRVAIPDRSRSAAPGPDGAGRRIASGGPGLEIGQSRSLVVVVRHGHTVPIAGNR